MEVGCGINDIGLLQIALQLLQEPLLFRDVAHDVQLVVLSLQTKQLPGVKQEVESVVGVRGLKRVAELETVLVEAEEVEAFAMEIAIELVSMASEAALVQMAPHGGHRLDELRVAKLVADDAPQVFVDSKQTDGLQVWQHIEEDRARFLSGREHMVQQSLHLLFLELVYGYECRRRVEQHLHTMRVGIRQVDGLQCLTEIGSHRDTTLHDVRLVDDGLFLARHVEQGKGKRALPDAYGHFPLVHHLAFITLATQTANSATAIRARMIFVSLLFICIIACKGR